MVPLCGQSSLSVSLPDQQSGSFAPENSRPGPDPGWTAPKRLPCSPCPDVMPDFLDRQLGLSRQGTQPFVNGRQHFRGLLGHEPGIKPVRHLPQLLGGKLLQGGLNFGHRAHGHLRCCFWVRWQVCDGDSFAQSLSAARLRRQGNGHHHGKKRTGIMARMVFRLTPSVRHGGERQLPGVVCSAIVRPFLHLFSNFGIAIAQRQPSELRSDSM